METLTPTSLLVPSSSAKQINSPDGVVLLDVREGRTFALDPMGAKIWEMLKQHQSAEEIIHSLVLEFHVPEEQVRQEVQDFLTSLKEHRLLIPSELTEPRVKFPGIRTLMNRFRSTANGNAK